MRSPLRILVPQLSPGSAAGNPELRLLYDAMARQDPIVVKQFTRWRALRGRWDIAHFYWPEWSVRRHRGSLVMLLDTWLFFATLRIIKLRGTKVVWSLNNFLPHEPDRRALIDRFIHTFARYVDHTICSSHTLLEEFIREYPILRGTEARIHPSSHYKHVYPDDGLTQAAARERLRLPRDATVLLLLGMLRRYKNISHLIRCFAEVAPARPDAFLLIAGPTMDDAFAAQLRRACRMHERIRLDLKYVEEPEIQVYLRAADCLLWPATLPGNSSTVMLALSYDCPVLVPLRGPFMELEESLGAEWVRTYRGGLRPSALVRALDPRPGGPLELDERYTWDAAAAQYLAVYRELAGVSAPPDVDQARVA
jgi:beta-1,4-mannosyltransferase